MAAKVIHFEVVGKDGPALQEFYGELFGWKVDAENPQRYGLVTADDAGIGGGIGPTPDGTPGYVTFYVQTDDGAATLRRVEELGGRVLMPLTEVVPGTTIALFADPEGHVIGLM